MAYKNLRKSVGQVNYFNSLIRTEWLSDGRTMRVMRRATYTDPKGYVWVLPEGSVIDGASIPKLLWTLKGSPFVGKYRGPSAFHDEYCGTRTRPHEEVHRMFYDAMLCAGVEKVDARRMYLAVASFGPKWAEDGSDFEYEYPEEW